MKTPRDILLARHQAVVPKLDAIRHAAVAAVCDRRKSHASVTSIWQTLWQELILPSHRTWAGLAGVWLILLAINFAQHEPAPSGKATPAPTMMSFREQQRLMNELFADRLPVTEAEGPRSFSPKPRTEIVEMMTV